MKSWIMVLLCALPLMGAQAAETGAPLKQIKVDTADLASLQRGARLFTNYCLSCHSVHYMRYSQLARGIGVSDAQVLKYLALPDARIGDPMTGAMPAKAARHWFGVAPPDLTLEARRRGPDWLYAYLTGFYLDARRPTGVNNTVFPNVAMPDVLWQQQGLQTPVYKTVKDAQGQTRTVIAGLTQASRGSMTPAQYDRSVRDLINYLTFLSAPYARESHTIGLWFILGLLVFTISAYLLKRAYWKNVH